MNNYTKDYYKILNISYPSSLEEIKSSYRNLSKLYHPDMGGNIQKMCEINEAYSILSNSHKKSNYDYWYSKNNIKVLAHILDAETGYYSEESVLISSIKADYNKYKDDVGDIYILIVNNNGNKRKTIALKENWLECFTKLHINQNTIQHVQAYIYDENIGIYKRQFSIKNLPDNYAEYQDTAGNVYLYRDYSKNNHPLIILHYTIWTSIAYGDTKRSEKQDTEKYDSSTISRDKYHILKNILSYLWIIPILFIIYMANKDVVSTSAPNNSAISANETISSTVAPTPSPKVVSVAPNGCIMKFPVDDCVAPLTIKTTNYVDDYYIYLQNIINPNNDMAFFTYGGTTVNIEVPLGQYKLFYCSGKNWYGLDYKFGDETVYFCSDELLSFWEDNNFIHGHTLELYKQVNGNFGTKNINASAFPE